MTDFYRYIETAKIGDDADAENLDSTMAGNNHFRYSTHTYSVTTQYTIHAILCRCLEGRSLNANIYTMLCINSLLLSNIVGKVAEFLVVCFVHIRETWTGREVLSAQWMFWEEVDV